MNICDNITLPSWTWTRTFNATHGQIRANVSIDDGHPVPLNVTVYQAQTVNGTKFVHFIDDHKIFLFVERRDFRLMKLDISTKTIVDNPIIWVEMNNTEVVRKHFLILPKI